MQEIYLDNAATTRPDDNVIETLCTALSIQYGNASSLHKKGLEAFKLLEYSRGKIAAALGCDRKEFIFTSGGTEANNLALMGAAMARHRKGHTIITTEVEHSSVLAPLARLEQQGWTIKRIPPLAGGGLDCDAMLSAIDDDTVLISAMLVNSEVGAISPIEQLSASVRRLGRDILIHCDAVQGFGKMPLSARLLGVDLLSVSAHKLHGPKGVGGLFVRKGTRILPLLYGGGQEGNLRPGTENPPLAAAFANAVSTAFSHMDENLDQVSDVYEHFVNIAKKTENLCINLPPMATPYICNISLPGFPSEVLLRYFSERGIFVSNGSACSKGAASHVLAAMKLSPQLINSAIRVSFSKYTTRRDVDIFFEALQAARKEIVQSH